MSKALLAEEVLSPSTMHMAANARPRKQARKQGPGALGGHAGSGSTMSRSATPADRVPSDGAAAANMMQSDPMQQGQLSMQQHLMAQQGLPDSLLQQMMLQQGQQQQVQGMPAGTGTLPNAADLQQAGHRPVMLACQLVLQQQANPVTLRPLFGAPATSTAPAPASRAQNMPGFASSAEMVNSALQLAQTGSGGNAQNHLDQLKAVTESAQAAAATASAVAAATALLWQQLQQQEQARARQREQELLQLGHGDDMPAEGQQEGGGVDAGGVDDAGIAAANEPAAPGSPVAAVVADPAAAQAASGSISRSSSSSTSAAGLSTAPGDSHGVEQPPAGAALGQDQQQPPVQQAPASPDAAAPEAEAVLGGAAVNAEGYGPASIEAVGAAHVLPDDFLLAQYFGPVVGNQGAGCDGLQQGHML